MYGKFMFQMKFWKPKLCLEWELQYLLSWPFLYMAPIDLVHTIKRTVSETDFGDFP